MNHVFYICDRQACPECNPDCHHTSNIEHAVNFKEMPEPDPGLSGNQYWEKEEE